MSSPSTPEGYNLVATPTMTPEARGLYSQLLNLLGPGAAGSAQFLQRLASGDEELFQQLEAPAMRQFEANLGQIGNRFSQYGAQGSSAYQQALGGAGAEMAEKLQSQRLGLQQGAVKDLNSMIMQLLGKSPYEYGLQEEGGFDFEKLIGELGPEVIKGIFQLLAAA